MVGRVHHRRLRKPRKLTNVPSSPNRRNTTGVRRPGGRSGHTLLVLPLQRLSIPRMRRQPLYPRKVRTPHLRQSRTECVLIARVLDFAPSACRCLIGRASAPHEFPSLIEAVISSEDEGDAIRRLIGNDAQTFVDVIDEVRSTYVRSSP